MPWQAIIGLIIQLILKRLVPGIPAAQSADTAEYQALATGLLEKRDTPYSKQEADALAQALPSFLDEIIKLLPPDFMNRLLRCGFKAGLSYLTTRDPGKVVTDFLQCTLAGITTPPVDPPGDGGNGGGNGGGGDGTAPVFRDVARCG